LFVLVNMHYQYLLTTNKDHSVRQARRSQV
jgi:hypothetical protein